MLVTPGFEGLLEDEVPIGVVGNHDILVARTSFDGEPTRIIGVELADGKDTDEELIGRGLWGVCILKTVFCFHIHRGNGGLGLGRPDVLALLSKMTQDGLVRVGAVPCRIGVGKPVEGIAVAGLDGFQPRLLDWKP